MKYFQPKKSITCLLLIALTSFYLHAFAQNVRNVSVSGFNAIGVSNGIDVHLTQGDAESVVIKGDAAAIRDVVVEKNGEKITIKYKDGINWSRLFRGKEVDVYVTFKNLYAISASGGSDVNNNGVFKTDRLTLSGSGGSDVELISLTCKNMSISASGGSDVSLKGVAQNMVAAVSGGSDINAFGFKVDYAKINASGGADVKIYVEKALTASASGGSDVAYKGNGSMQQTSTSKSASVKHIK